MKFFLLFSALVAAASAQLPGAAQVADNLCGNLDPNTCRQRAAQCIQLRRNAEDAQSNRQAIMECAQQNGISRQQIIAAIQAASNSQGGGEVLDNLPVGQDIILTMRRCAFAKAGLADANGNPNHEAIKANLENRFRVILADRPELLKAMLDALNTCPAPGNVEQPREFRSCLAANCIQNFQ